MNNPQNYRLTVDDIGGALFLAAAFLAAAMVNWPAMNVWIAQVLR